MTPPTDALRERIADLYGRDYCVLTGRATTGLKLLFDELVEGDILFPSYICPIAVYPAFYSGNQPEFCDVSVGDFNLTPETVSEAVTPDTDAVVASHMFGHPVDMAGLRAVCEDNDLTILEDAANVLGGSYGGTDLGTFGQASVVSFGHKKPIDAGGGGAVLTDDAALADRLADAASALPKLTENEYDTLYNRYVDVYGSVQSLRAVEPRATRLLAEFPSVFERLFTHGFPERVRTQLTVGLDQAEELVDRRRRVAEIYKDVLDHEAITHPEPIGDPVQFRYGLLLESETHRDDTLNELRDRGLEANSLHEPVDGIFEDGSSQPGAQEVSRRLLNLRDEPFLDDDDQIEYARAVLNAVETTYTG